MMWVLKVFALILNLSITYTLPAGDTDKGSTGICRTVVILNNGDESLLAVPSEASLILMVLPHLEEIRLELRRNDKLRLDNIAVNVVGDDGKTKQQWNVPLHDDIYFYHGLSRDAAISMKIVSTRPGVVDALFKGTLTLDGKRYQLEPQNSSNDTDARVHRLCELPAENTDRRTFRSRKTHIYETKLPKTAKYKPKSNHSRVKRNIIHMEEYHVELGVIVDHTIWDDAMNSKSNNRSAATAEVVQYLGHLLNGMNMIFQSIPTSAGFQVHVWLKHIYIAQTAEASIWTAKHIVSNGSLPSFTLIDGLKALDSLSDWSKKGGRNWTSPDHIMLLTKYDFKTRTLRSKGLSFVGGICSPGQGISIVEDHGLETFKTAAHELAHNLGAVHDNGICNPFYVMYSHSNQLYQIPASHVSRFFSFSPCTVTAFQLMLSGEADEYPRVCLHNKVCQQRIQPARNYSLNEQCMMAVGPHSHFCDSVYDSIGEPLSYVCKSLYCYVGRSSCSAVTFAQDGSYCGNSSTGNMLCLKGRCLPETAYAPVDSAPCRDTRLAIEPSSDCVDDPRFSVRYTWTDKKESIVRILDCEGIIQFAPHLCFNKQINAKIRCCRTCHLYGLAMTRSDSYDSPVHVPEARPADVMELENPWETSTKYYFENKTPTEEASNDVSPSGGESPGDNFQKGVAANESYPTPTDPPKKNTEVLIISLVSIVGVVIAVCVVAILIFLYFRKKKKGQTDQGATHQANGILPGITNNAYSNEGTSDISLGE